MNGFAQLRECVAGHGSLGDLGTFVADSMKLARLGLYKDVALEERAAAYERLCGDYMVDALQASPYAKAPIVKRMVAFLREPGVRRAMYLGLARCKDAKSLERDPAAMYHMFELNVLATFMRRRAPSLSAPIPLNPEEAVSLCFTMQRVGTCAKASLLESIQARDILFADYYANILRMIGNRSYDTFRKQVGCLRCPGCSKCRKCVNFELCETEAFEGKETCHPCSVFPVERVIFRDPVSPDETCATCLEKMPRFAQHPSGCSHFFCIACSRRVLGGSACDELLPAEDFGCPPCPATPRCLGCEACVLVELDWMDRCPAELAAWNTRMRQKAWETLRNALNTTSCPLCRSPVL